MKYLFPVVTFILGATVSWLFLKRSEKEFLENHFPKDFMDQVEIMMATPGFESSEALTESMDLIRKSANQAVREGDLHTFFAAYEAHRYKTKNKNGGEASMLEFADERLNEFRKRYEEGMEIGDWQKIAGAIYDKLKEEENQAVDTTAANARLFHTDISKSNNPDVEAMTEAAVVSP